MAAQKVRIRRPIKAALRSRYPPLGWLRDNSNDYVVNPTRPAHFGVPFQIDANASPYVPPPTASTTPIALGGGNASIIQSSATRTINPSKEIADAFEEMQARVAAVEKAIAGIPPQPARAGHNNPPEPIEDAPLSSGEWQELRRLIDVLKTQTALPTQEPTETIQAPGWLKVLTGKVLSFLGRHSEEFSSEFAKKLGENAADMAKWYAAWNLLSGQISGLGDAISAWLRSLGL